MHVSGLQEIFVDVECVCECVLVSVCARAHTLIITV